MRGTLSHLIRILDCIAILLEHGLYSCLRTRRPRCFRLLHLAANIIRIADLGRSVRGRLSSQRVECDTVEFNYYIALIS